MFRIKLLLRLLRESALAAFISLVSNKLRTILSLSGITIGIFAIIAVFTVIDALENNIRASIATLGDNMVYVQKWPWQMGGEYPWWKYVNRPEPTLDDCEQILRRSQLTEAATFGVGVRKTVSYKDNLAEGVDISGFTHAFKDIRSFEIEKGRYFSPYESQTGKNKAILGFSIAEQLFQGEDPIGKEVKIGGRKLIVVGVYKKEGEDMFGASNDKQVHIPVLFMNNYVNINQDNIGKYIMVKAKEGITADQLIDELRGHMRSIHSLKPSADDDFALNKSSLISEGFKSIFSAIDLVGFIIGGISILVGGFGIANIMFVSVKEQTRNIGIQKALGAKNYFVLFQFLSEAVVLCLLGGAVGLLLVFGATSLMSAMSEMEFPLTLHNISFGVSISVVIGIISGFFPARNAARLDPVQAMGSV